MFDAHDTPTVLYVCPPIVYTCRRKSKDDLSHDIVHRITVLRTNIKSYSIIITIILALKLTMPALMYVYKLIIKRIL